MNRRLVSSISLVLFLGLASGAYGAYWSGAVSSEWSNDENWQGGEPNIDRPTSLYITGSPPNWPVITQAGEVAPCRSYLQGDSVLTILSGDLSIHEKFFVGGRSHGAGSGTIDMYGGKLIVEDYEFGCAESGPRLSVSDEEPGTINLYDGEIIVKTHIAWPDGSGEGRINMYGGVFWTDEVSWKDKETCVMTFYASRDYPHGGTFIVAGDSTYPEDCDHCNSIWEKWHRGQVVTTIPSDRVSITYDPDEDETIVESVPNPWVLNEDDIVDYRDVEVLASLWLQRVRLDNPDSKADFNRDGAINLPDFAYLAADWHRSRPPQPE